MFLALTAHAARSASGVAGMGGSAMQTLSLPFLALLFALVLIGYSVWDLDQLSGPGAGPHYSLAIPRPVPAAVLVGVAAGSDGGVTTIVRPGVADQAASRAANPASPTGASPVLAPWVATGCRIAMGVTMAFMLMIMI
jgi:hypothetical protein